MRVELSIGSNIGDRRENLRRALKELDGCAGIARVATSRIYETAPVGMIDQSSFLNMAVEIETDIEPLELLNMVKTIELRMGRVPTERWGPRIIDIDIVLCESKIVETDALCIPHKNFRVRGFVLAPLAEIAPDVVDPITGCTVLQLASKPGIRDGVVVTEL